MTGPPAGGGNEDIDAVTTAAERLVIDVLGGTLCEPPPEPSNPSHKLGGPDTATSTSLLDLVAEPPPTLFDPTDTDPDPGEWEDSVAAASTDHNRPWDVIDRFTGRHHGWLSTFHAGHPFWWDGTAGCGTVQLCDPAEHPTIEHAFQSARAQHPQRLAGLLELPADELHHQAASHLAKPGWDTELALPAYLAILNAAYQAHPDLQTALVGTGDALLLDTNTTGDLRWGQPTNRRGGAAMRCGANWHGMALMALRDELAGLAPGQHLPRVAILSGPRTDTTDAWLPVEMDRVLHKLSGHYGAGCAIVSTSHPHGAIAAKQAASAAMAVWAYSPGSWEPQRWETDAQQRREHLTAIAARTVELPGEFAPARYYEIASMMVRDADVTVVVTDPRNPPDVELAVARSAMPTASQIIRVDVGERRTTVAAPARRRPRTAIA